MLEEARAGELRLGYVRLAVIVPCVAIVIALLSRAGSSATLNFAFLGLTLIWLAGAVTLVLALRAGWYERWVPRMVPILDASFILIGFFLWSYVIEAKGLRPASEALAYVTALCGFLSLSGALRLSRSAARAGTGLAVVVFLIAAARIEVNWVVGMAIGMTLLATGLLGVSMTTLLRRVITDEVARATFSRMYHEAEETIDAREQVLKIVSHDLRNPLSAISMTASLLLDVPTPPDKQAEHLRRIQRAGERMNRLIQDLLDVAKLEAGRVAIDARSIEVAPLIKEASELLAPLTATKSIRFEATAAERLPTIAADAGRVLQVISNLVGNAVKFTPVGGRIVLRADAEPGGVRFSVRDTGPGIPQEQLPQIFGRFWQANPADRRGIGLGLTIAKGIVEAHGGQIWVDSPPGDGTTFSFSLKTVLPAATTATRGSGKVARPLGARATSAG